MKKYDMNPTNEAEEPNSTNFDAEKLQSWGLANYIKVFTEQEIDKEAFLTMDADMAKELIPILGQRIKLFNNRALYIQSQTPNKVNDTVESSGADTEVSVPETSSSVGAASVESLMACPDESNCVDNGEELKKLLQQNPRGIAILNSQQARIVGLAILGA
ncbi:uncharacterized protein [Venturia canescens]|uniref:uncharacterized protein isoform X2 n=1 Tax=Venturia canescens TaxID=32260 RepID=UPI001C9CE710|nr:uncharacterized protein LOC122415918 isoform X2 [Venturia canescens]